jgi:hypothetical protein
MVADWNFSRLLAAQGKADWIWDEELGLHIPCCSRYRTSSTGAMQKCGNGPLGPKETKTGTCSQAGHIDPRNLTPQS